MDLHDFLNRIVFGWIKSDLERMTKEIHDFHREAGNINLPLALCVMAYLEYLGGFLRGNDGGFTENASVYIEECFDNPDQYPVDILRDLFRNGLAHEYFARASISRDGNRPPLYRRHDDEVILDIETMVADFLKSLDKFKEKLTSENFEKRLAGAEKSIAQMKERHKDLISKLPKPSSETTRTFGSSGASGYPGPIEATTTLPYDKKRT
jgi:hypothetical protein